MAVWWLSRHLPRSSAPTTSHLRWTNALQCKPYLIQLLQNLSTSQQNSQNWWNESHQVKPLINLLTTGITATFNPNSIPKTARRLQEWNALLSKGDSWKWFQFKRFLLQRGIFLFIFNEYRWSSNRGGDRRIGIGITWIGSGLFNRRQKASTEMEGRWCTRLCFV